MTSGDVDLGLRSYHTKRRFHLKIAFGLDISYRASAPNLFLVYFGTDVTSDRAPSGDFKSRPFDIHPECTDNCNSYKRN